MVTKIVDFQLKQADFQPPSISILTRKHFHRIQCYNGFNTKPVDTIISSAKNPMTRGVPILTIRFVSTQIICNNGSVR